jgi:hypothetical protein
MGKFLRAIPAQGAALGYHAGMAQVAAQDPKDLLTLLAEVGRLDLDLLVRDVPAAEAVGLLVALREELEAILARAATARAGARGDLADLERDLAAVWPGAAAASLLCRLAEARRSLADLDAALRPAQVLYEEVVRRSSRRASPGQPATDPGA